MKILFILLVVLEVILCVLVSCPTFVHDTAYDRVFSAHLNNPTQETAATLRAEWARIERVKTIAKILNLGLLVANSIALYGVWRRIRKSKRQETASRGRV